jgi:hypothetical protein
MGIHVDVRAIREAGGNAFVEGHRAHRRLNRTLVRMQRDRRNGPLDNNSNDNKSANIHLVRAT